MFKKSASETTIEDVRIYWDRRPCNVRHSPREIGSREYFDEVEARKYFVEPHIPGFAQFERWSGKRVLEIGCGIGTDATNFVRRGANYTGIELSEVSLKLTKKRFELFGLSGDFLLLDAEKLSQSLPSKSFDLVYSFGVIHHSPNPRAIIEEAHKVIRPDGELRIMLYAKRSWKAAMIEAGLDQPEAQSGCPIAFTYDERDINKLLLGLFTPIEIRQDHIFPYQIDSYVKHEYVRQPWFESMPPQFFRALEKSLGWHMMIVAKPE